MGHGSRDEVRWDMALEEWKRDEDIALGRELDGGMAFVEQE